MEPSILHYRCSFDVSEPYIKGDLWSDCIKTIRKWLSLRTNPGDDPYFGRAWIFRGGSWKHPITRGISIKVDRVIGAGSETAPQFWALSYRIPCSDCNQRLWQTDIGITILDTNRLRFNMQVGHKMMPHYLGELPPSPSPSAPGIVSFLLANNKWQCQIGEELLDKDPAKVTLGEAEKLTNSLRSPSRTCPIVVISTPCSGVPLVDAGLIQKLLGGVANVYVLLNQDVAEEFDYYMGDRYRCNGGMIRIYLPSIDIKNESDQWRHRFFLPRDIIDFGADEVTGMIVRMLCRYTPRKRGQSIYAIDELIAVERTLRLNELRAHISAQPDESQSELIELYENELQSLETKIEDLEGENEALQYAGMEKDDDLRRLEREKDGAVAREQQAYAQTSDLVKKQTNLDIIRNLPTTLEDVLRSVGGLFPESLLIATPAIRSSREYKGFTDISLAWSCLWSIATQLHKLYCNESSLDIERRFREISGFELALNEGRLTNRNKKLTQLRKINIGDKEFDITPHVKAGGNKEPKCLRVYYAWEQESQKLVIGHCGAHLDNATTTKLH
ncbi:MAG: hypothetical protein JXR40_12110 [Pontiellaceae bacterium]|nr:hypothetical protein [Pontiellaceae bacterium]